MVIKLYYFYIKTPTTLYILPLLTQYKKVVHSASITPAALKISFTDWEISGPIPSPGIMVTICLASVE